VAIIIGSMTTVIIDNNSDGFQSVNWAAQVQPTRLWELGSWSMYKTQVAKTITVNVTTYASVLSSIVLAPNEDCSDSTAIKDVSISVTECGAVDLPDMPDLADMFVMSYSYSKSDPNAFGTETWQYQKWVEADAEGDDFINVGAPTYVIQGKAEGSMSGNVTNLGVIMDVDGQVSGQQGNVSAGFPGLGNFDETTYGLVNTIGDGTLEEAGKTGQSNATIPHQPLYLGT